MKKNIKSQRSGRVNSGRASNYSKNKGNSFERRCVKIAQAKNLPAERMWGSDGRSRGLPKDVDIVVGDMHCQCKKRARIASYMKIPEGCNATIIAEDYGKPLIVLDYEEYLDRYIDLMEVMNEVKRK